MEVQRGLANVIEGQGDRERRHRGIGLRKFRERFAECLRRLAGRVAKPAAQTGQLREAVAENRRDLVGVMHVIRSRRAE